MTTPYVQVSRPIRGTYSVDEIESAKRYLESFDTYLFPWAEVAYAAILQCRAHGAPDVQAKRVSDGYLYEPTAAQVIRHRDAGGQLEEWNVALRQWQVSPSPGWNDWWQAGDMDIPHAGYRLAPISEQREP